MAGNARHVLVIEDDAETGEQLLDWLRTSGYEVDLAVDGEEGLRRGLAGGYVVMTIDRMVPRIDGLEVIRRLREEGVATPALILSALGEVDDRVRGLRAGGGRLLGKAVRLSGDGSACRRTRTSQRNRHQGNDATGRRPGDRSVSADSLPAWPEHRPITERVQTPDVSGSQCRSSGVAGHASAGNMGSPL